MTERRPSDAGESYRPGVALTGGIATPELVASLLVDGDDDLVAWAIGEALAEQSRAVVYDDVLRRAMGLVGSRWEEGRWTVAEEHLASVALANALGRLRPMLAPDPVIGRVAVLAAPEGERHVAGLVCLAHVLEEDGWRVENLGADVPPGDLVSFVSAREVDLIALSIGTADRRDALQTAIDALRGAGAPGGSVPIMVGGRGVEGIEGEVTGADLVTASLADADRVRARAEDRSTAGLMPGPATTPACGVTPRPVRSSRPQR